jgi:hypothetical protein
MSLQNIRLKINQLIQEEVHQIKEKRNLIQLLVKKSNQKKSTAIDNAELAQELAKAAMVSVGVSFLIPKVLKIHNPIIKTLLIPAITSAIVKSNLFKKKTLNYC